MTNFAYDMIISGKFQYRKERFELDKECLSFKLYKATGGLHAYNFLSMAKNANRLGEYKWSERLCKDYADTIVPSGKEFAVKYVNADIYFAKKEYDKALELLSKFKFELVNEKQLTRNLRVMIYYEMHEDNSALSIIDTSKHFLHNDKQLSTNLKENYSNFIKFAGGLIKARESMKPKVIFQLEKSIDTAGNTHNKDWLLEKIEELSGKI
jgi:hypothetical protein